MNMRVKPEKRWPMARNFAKIQTEITEKSSILGLIWHFNPKKLFWLFGVFQHPKPKTKQKLKNTPKNPKTQNPKQNFVSSLDILSHMS